jgi:hypothetical protein
MILTKQGLVRKTISNSLDAELQKELNQAFQTRISRGMRAERYLRYWYFENRK